MPTLDVVDMNCQRISEMKLNPEVFAVEEKEQLLREVVVMQMASRRRGTASTKTVGEVRGSKVKPWRQKGTGRARAGNRQSPLWRGGGVVFGPKPRNYSYSVPKKVRRAALKVALSLKIRENNLIIVDRVVIERPKTKEIVAFLKGLNVSGKTLIVLPEIEKNLALSVRNLPQAKALTVGALNVYDLLYHGKVISTREAVAQIEETLLR